MTAVNTLVILFLALATAFGARPVAADDGVFLHATFQGKPLDASVGTGGAAVGEPVTVDWDAITAIVRATPMPSASLEITDDDDYYAGYVRFKLLDNTEVTTGELNIRFDLWFAELEGFTIGVREAQSEAEDFLSLYFTEGGSVQADDAGGQTAASAVYATGRLYPVEVAYDLDAGTYDLFLDGVKVLDDEPHDVVGHGVGGVIVGTLNDADLDGTMYLDDLVVSRPGLVFHDGFISGDTSVWSQVVPE